MVALCDNLLLLRQLRERTDLPSLLDKRIFLRHTSARCHHDIDTGIKTATITCLMRYRCKTTIFFDSLPSFYIYESPRSYPSGTLSYYLGLDLLAKLPYGIIRPRPWGQLDGHERGTEETYDKNEITNSDLIFLPNLLHLK